MNPSAQQRRPGRPRDESIDAAILDAAVSEFIDRGFAGMSMESVAARAGVAKTTLYRRWPTIEELMVAAVCDVDYAQAQDEPRAGDSVRDELLRLLDAMRRKWTNPKYGALMRRAAADGTHQPELFLHMRERIVGPHIAAMNRALRRGVAEGIIRADVDIDWTRQLLTSPMLAATLVLKPRITRAQVEFVLDTVLAGLAP